MGLLKFRSLTFKISLVVLLVSILLGSYFIYSYLKFVESESLSSGTTYLEEVAYRKKIDLDFEFTHFRRKVESLSSVFQSQIGQYSYSSSWQHIEAAVGKDMALAYFISDDRQVYSQHRRWRDEMRMESDLTNSTFYRIADNSNANRGYWSQVHFDDVLDLWVVYYGLPIYQDNKFVGVFGGALNIDPIINKLKRNYLIKSGKFFIYDSDKNIIFHPDYGASLIRQTDNYTITGSGSKIVRDSLFEYMQSDRLDGELTEFLDWGKKVYAVGYQIPSIHWTIVSYQNKQTMLRDTEEKVMTLAVLVGIVILIIWSAVYFSGKLLIAKKLAQTAKSINGVDVNDPQYQVNAFGEDEIDDLHAQLKQLFARFKSKQQENDRTLSKLKEEVESNKALAQAVSYSDNAVIILELDFAITYVDAKALAMLKCDRDTLLGSRFFSFIHEHMAFISEQIVNEIRRKKSWHGELVLKEQSNGKQVWVNSTITPMRDEHGNVTKFVLSMQDISFIKDSQNKIEKLAYTDELTGLANRTFFIAQLEKLVEISKRGRYEFALFYFDVDDFKRVNDIHGHECGDLLLVELANRLNTNLRNEDVLARMGGDEFALIMGGASNEQEALNIAHDILSAANKPFQIRDEEIISGTSIGITLSTNDVKDAETLLQHSDLAMYEAKATGKNTYHFYTKALNEAARERQEIESALKYALMHNELELYYQPKVNSQTKQLIGYEALLRWNSAKLGFVSPGRFIPIAEQSNLILQIGSWVMHEACTFAASDDIEVPVSINLSARQFESGDCIRELQAILYETGVLTSNIELEITESHLMSDVEDAIRQLHALKELGVAISIDDFGTGYSSLSYLKRFPVDTLKIDRSFIKDIPNDVSDVEITGAIIAMAQKLGLEVIAEGAETADQVDFLAQNGCYNIQGYFFSRPLPAQEARTWVYKESDA